jgi:hypothetical protein
VEPELATQPVARVAIYLGGSIRRNLRAPYPKNGIISSATMFTSFSIGLMAGPAVSL